MFSEIERRAWESRDDASKHKPEMAARAIVDQIARGKIKPRHVIVVYVEEDENGGDRVGYTQAGDMSQLAVEGALARAIWVSKESGG